MIRFIFIILLAGFIQSAVAQTRSTVKGGNKKDKKTGDTYALIVGISNYASVTDLKYADKDAMSFDRFLRTGRGGNVPSANIFCFVNDQATKVNITDALSIICSRLKDGDRFYFFFAGHGDMEVRAQKENGLLLLHNSPAGGYFGIIDDVLEINQLRNYLTPVTNKGVQVMYIIDACHSGQLSGGKEGAQQTAAAFLASWGNEHKILSCQPNQYSLEGANWGGGRGLFSVKLEEALNGAADENKDGVISMLELYIYTASRVSRESKYSQIPIVSGDLSSRFITISPNAVSTANSEAKHTAGNAEAFVDISAALQQLDATARKMYGQFDSMINADNIIYPWDNNALNTFISFRDGKYSIAMETIMRRKLILALMKRFDNIVTPQLMGKTSYSNKDECLYARLELEYCMSLLEQQHYLYDNVRARKLYMNAMELTWALADNDYNIGMRPVVERAIDSLELSYTLEQNAAYTSLALGERYAMIGDIKQAKKYFNEYLGLRPGSFYGKFSLAQLYGKLEQYREAEKLYRELADSFLNDPYTRWKVSDMLVSQGKYKDALLNIEKLAALDLQNYYFYKGLMFGNMDMTDSALNCYRQLKAIASPALAELVDNNAGHMFFVSRRIDSAYNRWISVLNKNIKSPFPNFNVGSVEVLKGNYREAIKYFERCIENAKDNPENLVIHSEMYMGKQFNNLNTPAGKRFSRKVYTYKIRYFGYLNVLYCYLRDPQLKNKTAEINEQFSNMRKFKDFEMFTHYHYACWRSLNNDIDGAIDSIEKALQAGFGSYFQLTNDLDLQPLWSNQRYIDLLNRYFGMTK